MSLLQRFRRGETAQVSQCGEINESVTPRGILYFVKATVHSCPRMADHSRTHHVQIDIHKTALQVCIIFNRRCVIAVFPECALTCLSAVVLLRRSPGYQLHTVQSDAFGPVQKEQVNLVGGDYLIEDAQTEALARLEQPPQAVKSIASELEQEFAAMTAVSNVPDKTG
jgi:hypothetical protein